MARVTVSVMLWTSPVTTAWTPDTTASRRAVGRLVVRPSTRSQVDGVAGGALGASAVASASGVGPLAVLVAVAGSISVCACSEDGTNSATNGATNGSPNSETSETRLRRMDGFTGAVGSGR